MLKKDDTVQILLINANGKVFQLVAIWLRCKELLMQMMYNLLFALQNLSIKFLFALKRLPKPVVMSTDGAVAGAAANIAVAADFVLPVTKHALFKPL